MKSIVKASLAVALGGIGHIDSSQQAVKRLETAFGTKFDEPVRKTQKQRIIEASKGRTVRSSDGREYTATRTMIRLN